MEEYEFSDKDYQVVYELATRDFKEQGLKHKQTYQNFLMRCILKSLLGYMKAKKIEVREGKLFYVSKEEH